MKVGGLFTCKFYDDSPWILATGGVKGELGIWDLEESELVVKRFQGEEAYLKLKAEEIELGVEGRASPELENDDDDDESDHIDDEHEMEHNEDEEES